MAYNAHESHEAIRVRRSGPVCRVRLHRPESDNTINDAMIRECHEVLRTCESEDSGVSVVVFEGQPEVFCHGADLTAYAEGQREGEYDPSPLYDLWLRMATGPCITVSHVRGKANAGGVGFVAASDIVIAEPTAAFSLSELLFGLYPAMVMPFLVRRIGYQRAHYMTLMTRAITAEQAAHWGLADACAERSGALVSQHLSRLSKLPKDGIARYKRFMNSQIEPVDVGRHREGAVSANVEIFSNADNLDRIARFVEHGIYPWENASAG
ncbi:enoyl-CoA hydratase/isomerase [Streptomyces sp. 6N223]|uniref:enoyl-CoA hydratase/isomerase n=1 Tax=Streptomyces sp. 6N223 TaxID=3457412 RepID=UPI003FD36130